MRDTGYMYSASGLLNSYNTMYVLQLPFSPGGNIFVTERFTGLYSTNLLPLFLIVLQLGMAVGYNMTSKQLWALGDMVMDDMKKKGIDFDAMKAYTDKCLEKFNDFQDIKNHNINDIVDIGIREYAEKDPNGMGGKIAAKQEYIDKILI